MSHGDLEIKAKSLVKDLADNCFSQNGIGSMSISIYDTAWIATISKKVAGKTEWLVPESFQFLLDSQLPNGSWDSYASEVDGILNSMAALLALKTHAKAPQNAGPHLSEDLNSRILKTTISLQLMLSEWNVETTVHVGFEILVPSLLNLLEDEGVCFDFKGRRLLMALNKEKLAKIDVRMLYGAKASTLLHSLEAFIGKIDFDQISHQKVLGSMMASPSSTAAYLMHTSCWDLEAEAYIRTVVAIGLGRGNGSVPPAFPITTFEVSWVISTLLESGYSTETLGHENMERTAQYLESQLKAGQGLVGFAPSTIADADDTAKTATTLHLMGRNASLDPMIMKFEGKLHFKTYQDERDPSLSANCNVLKALLHSPSPAHYTPQILKITTFLCDSWWNGTITDKWNLSIYYTMMLLAQGLIRLLKICDRPRFPPLPDALVKQKIPIILFQILSRILSNQRSCGSWGLKDSSEETAYSILALVAIYSIAWGSEVRSLVATAVERGREFLRDQDWTISDYLWIEKVTYRSSIFSHAFSLAAMHMPLHPDCSGEIEVGLADVPPQVMAGFSKLFSKLPLFADEPKWKTELGIVEGYMFIPQLKAIRLNIFPRRGMEEDKYLEYIPLTWTLSNNLTGGSLPTSILWEMMVLSMLNYQADEYMEAVVGKYGGEELDIVKQIISHLCESSNSQINENGKRSRPRHEDEGPKKRLPSLNEASNASLSDVEETLGRYVDYVKSHAESKHASMSDRSWLRNELCTFLLAHITHTEDNARFSRQEPSTTTPTTFQTPRSSFYEWVHTTSANHTSCPYSFAFFCSLTNRAGNDCFANLPQRYISQDLCRHLAVMCRMYNDYGSIQRDRLERNLNSINFPDFIDGDGAGAEELANRSSSFSKVNDDASETACKEKLFHVAEYERKCLQLAIAEARAVISKRTAGCLEVFINVTDLYGQIYVVKDIASRMR